MIFWYPHCYVLAVTNNFYQDYTGSWNKISLKLTVSLFFAGKEKSSLEPQPQFCSSYGLLIHLLRDMIYSFWSMNSIEKYNLLRRAFEMISLHWSLFDTVFDTAKKFFLLLNKKLLCWLFYANAIVFDVMDSFQVIHENHTSERTFTGKIVYLKKRQRRLVATKVLLPS